MIPYGFGFRGRPPRLPLAREAAALASLVARPAPAAAQDGQTSGRWWVGQCGSDRTAQAVQVARFGIRARLGLVKGGEVIDPAAVHHGDPASGAAIHCDRLKASPVGVVAQGGERQGLGPFRVVCEHANIETQRVGFVKGIVRAGQ